MNNTDYIGTKLPLEDTMLIFRDNKFKPSCCPSPYTNSVGCACIASNQYDYLSQRGGNKAMDGEDI